MGLFLLLAGLILLIAGGGWFAAAATVGLILAIAGGVLVAIQVIWFVFVARKAKSIHDEATRGLGGRF